MCIFTSHNENPDLIIDPVFLPLSNLIRPVVAKALRPLWEEERVAGVVPITIAIRYQYLSLHSVIRLRSHYIAALVFAFLFLCQFVK